MGQREVQRDDARKEPKRTREEGAEAGRGQMAGDRVEGEGVGGVGPAEGRAQALECPLEGMWQRTEGSMRQACPQEG